MDRRRFRLGPRSVAIDKLDRKSGPERDACERSGHHPQVVTALSFFRASSKRSRCEEKFEISNTIQTSFSGSRDKFVHPPLVLIVELQYAHRRRNCVDEIRCRCASQLSSGIALGKLLVNLSVDSVDGLNASDVAQFCGIATGWVHRESRKANRRVNGSLGLRCGRRFAYDCGRT